MNKLIWRDVSSYSRDKHKEPNAWELNAGRFRIAVVKGHINNPNRWVMHLNSLFSERDIGPDSMTAEEAQQAALAIFKKTLSDALKVVS